MSERAQVDAALAAAEAANRLAPLWIASLLAMQDGKPLPDLRPSIVRDVAVLRAWLARPQWCDEVERFSRFRIQFQALVDFFDAKGAANVRIGSEV